MQCEKCGKKIYANETCVCGQKAPKKNNGAVRTNSVICFILLIITSLCLILTLSLRTIANKNLLTKAVEEVKLTEIEVNNGKKLDQYIYDEFIDDERITLENVDNILNDPFIKNFISEKITAYRDFVLDEGKMPYITADEIVALIDDNSELLYNEAGLRFLDADKAELKESLSALDSFESVSKDINDSKIASKFIQTYFSYANVIFSIVFMAIIFLQWLIVYKANSRRAPKMFLKYGIAVVIPSALIFLSVITLKILPSADTADKLIGSVKTPFFVYSFILLIIGALMTVSGILLNKRYRLRNIVGEVTAETTPKTKTAPKTETVTPEPVMKNICPNCSFENKNTAAFCSRCGTKLGGKDEN